MKGRFIVLEGIDGCGKSTQIKNLQNWLPRSGLMPKGAKLHLTREPGGTALGKTIRNLLLNPPQKNEPTSITELLLYAADRSQHISQLIAPALDNGDWVLSDRFTGSTLAYQGYGRGLSLETIEKLELIACQGIFPDLTFLLDLEVQESINRRELKENDRIEQEGEKFLKKVALGFSMIAKKKKWIKINANQAIEKVSTELQAILIKSL